MHSLHSILYFFQCNIAKKSVCSNRMLKKYNNAGSNSRSPALRELLCDAAVSGSTLAASLLTRTPTGRQVLLLRTHTERLTQWHALAHSHTKRIPAAIRRNQCTALPQQIPKQAATTRKAAAPAPGPGRESGRRPPTGTRGSSKRQQQQLDFRRQHQSRTRCRCRRRC